MNTNPTPTIRPEAIAAKLAALRNFEEPAILLEMEKEPRLSELLWYIQWHSFQPGGLNKFIENFLATHADLVGTPSMIRFGMGSKSFSRDQCETVWNEFPSSVQGEIIRSGCSAFPDLTIRDAHSKSNDWEKLFELNIAYFRRRCREEALSCLPKYLFTLCTDRTASFADSPKYWPCSSAQMTGAREEWHECGVTWYFPKVISALLTAMDQQSKNVSAKLAMTAVTLKVFDALDYAWSENALVHIEGDSRFGKTESVRAWANMHPGRARLVATPCTNSDSDLYKEVANAIGMEVSASRSRVKDRVEYVLQNGRLGIIFDEASFILPQRYTAITAPMRLNWIRTQIVDKGLPLVLCATPQTYTHTLAKFVKKTGHNIQQFLGRTMRRVVLPNELEECDLLAVAKIHFPELDEDYLALISAKAMQSESYLKAIESIAKLSRYIAKRDGHKQVEMADLELAFAEILPPIAQPKENPEQPFKRPDRRIAKPVNKPSKTQLLRQELRPLVNEDQETISSTDRNRMNESADALIPV